MDKDIIIEEIQKKLEERGMSLSHLGVDDAEDLEIMALKFFLSNMDDVIFDRDPEEFMEDFPDDDAILDDWTEVF